MSPKRARRRRSARWWYSLFLFVVGVGTLAASLIVGVVMSYVNSLPPIEKLEEYNPQQVTSVYDRSGKELVGEFASERRQIMAIDEVPDFLKRAVLAIEDDQFYEHIGVDLKAVVRALVANNKAGKKVQGASTITMQVPRNILPEMGERIWQRKIKETFMAFQIERRYSKDQILEFYLNQIWMGNNAYGMYAGAQTYFDKEPKDLTLAECAMLAAVPNNANLFNPLSSRPKTQARLLERRDLVLWRMKTLKWISPEQYDLAKATPITLKPGRRRTHVAHSEYPYFVDGLYRDLQKSYKMTDKEIRESGYLIHSTVNTRYQLVVEEELRKGLVAAERLWDQLKHQKRVDKEQVTFPDPPRAGETRLMQIVDRPSTTTVEVALKGYTGTIEFPQNLPYYEPNNILKKGKWIDAEVVKTNASTLRMELKPHDVGRLQGAAVVLDARTCEVLAMSGGYDFHDAANDGQFNRAYQGGKSAGSTVKPFFYAAALSHGFQPNDIVVDERIEIPSKPKVYIPRNFEGKNMFFGPTTLLEALEHSRNVATIRLFQRVGVSRSIADVAKFDFRYDDSEWTKKFRKEISICLGPVDMNVLEVAAGYAVFANQGIGKKPQFFRSITDRHGADVKKPQLDEAIVLDPIAAFQTLYMLRQAARDGTGKKYVGERFPSPPYPPICGKTGTTNDATDAWFTGFTPDLVISCYVGFDTPRSMGPFMTGGRVSAPIWGNIFERIYATRDDWRMQFDEPGGIEYCDTADTGKRAAKWSGSYGRKVYRAVPYKKGTAPREMDDGSARTPIVGSGGVRVVPGEESESPSFSAIDTDDAPAATTGDDRFGPPPGIN